jgi:hypothetical protein
MKTRLDATERILKLRKEQDLQLRDSIFMATREVRTCCYEAGKEDVFSPQPFLDRLGSARLGNIGNAPEAWPASRFQ